MQYKKGLQSVWGVSSGLPQRVLPVQSGAMTYQNESLMQQERTRMAWSKLYLNNIYLFKKKRLPKMKIIIIGRLHIYCIFPKNTYASDMCNM